MKTYQAVAAEIERLKVKAESLRKSETAGVISRIKEAIEAYGLTAEDLGFANRAARGGRKAAQPAKEKPAVGVAKYRDPASGKTWTGRGKPPDWIKNAKDRDAFLIEGGSAVPTKAAVRSAAPKRGRGKAAPSTVGVAKYRDAATGKTWTGRGKPPDWIKNAKDRSAFLIDSGSAAAS